MAAGVLRWAAVWSEVKGEGRIGLIRSDGLVNRPGGHERNTAAHRSALSLASMLKRNWVSTQQGLQGRPHIRQHRRVPDFRHMDAVSLIL